MRRIRCLASRARLAAAAAVLLLTASPSLASPAPDPQGRSDVAVDSGVRVVTRLFR